MYSEENGDDGEKATYMSDEDEAWLTEEEMKEYVDSQKAG